jgi:3-hydroxyisobutyrate dehydrogenase-like beta-hydroxyacid dehydrogenase
MRIAVLGLGEAGAHYAEGFASLGATVTAYDPMAAPDLRDVRQAPTLRDAVEGADYAISLVGAVVSSSVLDEALESLGTSTIFADLNTGSPELKQGLSRRAAASGIRFVDIAVMAPVPRAGIMTPLLASGGSAPRLVDDWAKLGIPVSAVGEVAGDAAGLKLLRSVFMKGLAALVFESTTAAEKVGAKPWMIDEIAVELGPEGRALVDRLVEGTRTHAERRAHEMEDVAEYLHALNAPSWMTTSTITWLRAIAEQGG